MADLLTRAEYAFIPTDLDLSVTPFTGGKFRKGKGPVIPTVNRAMGETITHVSTVDATDVNLAIQKTREALEQRQWSRMHPSAQGCSDQALQIHHPSPAQTDRD
ncbi:MAG: hypothetical protein AB8B62_00970 [Roseobacter sp.]